MGKFNGFNTGASNMQGLMRQAQRMQQEVARVQEEVGNTDFEASVGGGAVKVVVNGNKEFKSIEISPAAVDPDDVEMLQDLILSAVNEAVRLANETMEKEMSKVTGGLGNLGGLGFLFFCRTKWKVSTDLSRGSTACPESASKQHNGLLTILSPFPMRMQQPLRIRLRMRTGLFIFALSAVTIRKMRFARSAPIRNAAPTPCALLKMRAMLFLWNVCVNITEGTMFSAAFFPQWTE